MTETLNVEHRNGETLIRIPMKLKKRGGRKEVIVADGLAQRMANPDMDVPFVIALARAHAWQELLDSGKYRSVREMAKHLGVCHTYMARLLRWTILAPDIIEAILDGREPDRLSQTKLTGAIPTRWEVQRNQWILIR